MGMQSPHNERTRAIGIAVGISIVAAVATMLIPTSILETITGATGLSEIFKATAAPLGDKARALIAFTTGSVTLALALGMLSRKSASAAPSSHKSIADIESEKMPLLSQIQHHIGKLNFLKLPWTRNAGSDDVYELSDLPRLRSQDAHPDTPRRRPISAATDFGGIGLDGKQVYMPDVPMPVSNAPAVPMPAATIQTAETFPAAESEGLNDGYEAQPFHAQVAAENVHEEFGHTDFTQAFDVPESGNADEMHTSAIPESAADIEFSVAEVMNTEPQPSLSELVAQFEAAVERRSDQLAALEAIAQNLSAHVDLENTEPVQPEKPEAAEFVPSEVLQPEPLRPLSRPTLEAVPTTARPGNEDEMDAALNAALATLQRMNAK
jgi:hypothetical protein